MVAFACVSRRRSLHLAALLLLAFAKPLRDRGSSWDQRGFVGEPLREIGVILLHDIEHGFPGELAMILGQKPMQVREFFGGDGRISHNAGIYRNLLIQRQLLACINAGQGSGRGLLRVGNSGSVPCFAWGRWCSPASPAGGCCPWRPPEGRPPGR